MSGGTFQHGWSVMEVPDLYLRAVHHAVVVDGDRLVDVSPPMGTYETILLVPTADPGVMDGHFAAHIRGIAPVERVPSRYHPLADSAAVRRIVQLHTKKDRLGKWSPEWSILLNEIADAELQARDHAELLRDRRRRSKRRGA